MQEYRCFHCKQVFTELLAEQHFGEYAEVPECIKLLRSGGGGGPHDPRRSLLQHELEKAEAEKAQLEEVLKAKQEEMYSEKDRRVAAQEELLKQQERIAALEEQLKQAGEALKALHDDVAEYQQINNLGGYEQSRHEASACRHRGGQQGAGMTSLQNPVPDWAKQLANGPHDKYPAWLRVLKYNRWRWRDRQHPKAVNKEGK